MKVLIWIVCAFCFGTITTIFKYNGVILGGIPTAFLFLITVGLRPCFVRNGTIISKKRKIKNILSNNKQL